MCFSVLSKDTFLLIYQMKMFFRNDEIRHFQKIEFTTNELIKKEFLKQYFETTDCDPLVRHGVK